MANSSKSRFLDGIPDVTSGFAAIDDFVTTSSKTMDRDLLEEIVSRLSQDERVQHRIAGALFCTACTQVSDAFSLLSRHYASDPDWKVRETVAKAFDRLCRKNGYAESLPQIRRWLNHRNAGMRRAASEGLRPWTNRSPFKEEPALAISLLAARRDDADASVRLSIANALADISKKHPEAVSRELATWDRSNPKIVQLLKRASRHLPLAPR
jgi:3-methyladenine DNA glycosylase AlkC